MASSKRRGSNNGGDFCTPATAFAGRFSLPSPLFLRDAHKEHRKTLASTPPLPPPSLPPTPSLTQYSLSRSLPPTPTHSHTHTHITDAGVAGGSVEEANEAAAEDEEIAAEAGAAIAAVGEGVVVVIVEEEGEESVGAMVGEGAGEGKDEVGLEEGGRRRRSLCGTFSFLILG